MCARHDSICFFHDPATTEIYTLSLHDALPISAREIAMRNPCEHIEPPGDSGDGFGDQLAGNPGEGDAVAGEALHKVRSEEHTSELQSRVDLVCRLLLEKKKK